MNRKRQMNSFLEQKIKQVDENLKGATQDVTKLKLATMRTSYAQIMCNFLENDSQLPNCYFQQAIIYMSNAKFEQAISKAQITKKNLEGITKNQVTKNLSENIDLLLVECYLKNKKGDDALSIIEQVEITSEENKEKYLSLKGQIYQTFDNESKSTENYEQLHKLIVRKYGDKSLQDGLCLIEMGKNQGHFDNQEEGINLMNQGMEILISQRYNNPNNVAQIYEALAEFSRQIQDFEKEYSSLICAYSMIKQLQQNQQKRSIQILSKLSSNLLKRELKQKALEYLIKVQQIQRKIYGQSSCNLARTVKKIINLLGEMNRQSDAKKYENQYEHLIGVNQVTASRTLAYNNVNNLNNTIAHNMTSTSSISRQRLHLSGFGRNGNVSKIVN